ncbi:CobQ/CobB/MinD/ParA family nucleotide binding protein [Marinobacter pelagius]|jgi:hypothetical protein|uniref:CobQ/CobB/MinD/ParA family nucleotide binding protein n=2 Tax=Marinobacter TaxID=2742 RepID=A0A368UMZ5_MARNT|nr:CobQ/CobB/MinD/ParA family nucleotide binding protein [Marinobacter pelagius]RBP68702.1 CobQ/CobB/MinD/ParA family nucleotide binding protein [Marinobacter nauticus]RCW30139.1 CobQ/CobB/MinD/ParA family nucleotide binding protein [Marinobacter nauticus]
MAKAHFTLQGKGGVGKSLVSALIAQHRHENNIPLICVDTDPVNATFAGYDAFPVKRVELMNGNKIDEAEFDRLMEMIAENPDSEIVIDNGASSFIPLSSYLVENQAIELLQEMGHQIVIHPVITGGQALMDTLTGFDSLAHQFPETAEIVVWLNQYFGDIEKDGKTFEQMKVYQNHKSRVNGIINIKKQSDLFGRDVKHMLESRQTFDQAMQSEEYNFMSKNRLRMMKKDLWEQMDLVLGLPMQKKAADKKQEKVSDAT